MDTKAFEIAIKKLRESPKRKFSQSVDLIINLKQIDLKNPEHKVDLPIILPAGLGKKVTICGLVDKELSDQSKTIFDHTIQKEQFTKLDPKETKKLADQYDFFVAQSTLMVDIAKVFGKTFGPKSKMPNPKMGCVVPPSASLAQVKERLSKTIRIQNKKELIVKTFIGKESMSDEQLVQNATAVMESLLRALPHEKQNIASIYLKFTMSSPVLVGGK